VFGLRLNNQSSRFLSNSQAMDFGMKTALAEKIQNYGTAVTIGVLIGTAVTTGIAAGLAGWYAANKSLIFSGASTFSSTISTFLQDNTSSVPQEEYKQTIAELHERVSTLEQNFRILNSVELGSESKTEVSL